MFRLVLLLKIVICVASHWDPLGSIDPPSLDMPGHVTVGVLSELRQNDGGPQGLCKTAVSTWGLQEVAALEWALATINNQSSTDFTIGMKVYDSCGNEDRIIRQASKLVRENENINSPLLGIIALGSPSLVEATVSFLHAYSVPLLTTHAPSSARVIKSNNVFTTAPHLYAQIQAVISVIIRQRKHISLLDQEHRLGVLSGCEQALKIFRDHSKKSMINIHSTIEVNPQDDAKIAEKTLDFIKSQVGFQGTVVVLLEAKGVNALAEGMFGQLLKRSQTSWIFAVLDGESTKGELNVAKMHEVFPGAVVVEPYSPLLPGLNQHLERSMDGNNSVVASLLPFINDNRPCLKTNSTSAVAKLCALTPSSKGKHLLSGSRATAAVKAVSSIAAAFRLVQIDKCPEKEDGMCPQAITPNIKQDMLEGLMKLSYSPQGSSDNIRYTADGRLISSFIISRVIPFGFQQVGKFREDTGMVWTHPLPGMRHYDSNGESENNYVIPDDSDVKTYPSDDRKSRNIPFDYLQIQEYPHNDGIIKEMLMTHQDYISRTWALTVLVISCIGILCSLYVGVYVALRYCDGTIAGPQVLGGLLLFGVICVYGSCIVYILPPSCVICHLRAWVPNLALALCFSVLLVKGMQLRALVSVGLGGEVSRSNLYLSLLFMMAVEVALTLVGHRDILEDRLQMPLVELDSNGMRQCRREKIATLITQDYLLILLVFGVVLGVANRHIHRNHNEGRCLLLVSSVSTPVVLIWAVMSFLAPAGLEPPTTCFACITMASCILLLVFVPKIKVISKQASDFKHKRLSTTPSLSTIFTQLDMPHHALQPPPLFCDAPYKHGCSITSKSASIRSSYPGDSSTVRSYPGDLGRVKSWRDHMQESPVRQSLPPPPPPPVRNPLYYSTSSACYP